MSQPNNERFNARAFQPIEPGTRVLAVTCPILADALLRERLGAEGFAAIQNDYLSIFRAFEANPVHGVLCAVANAVEPPEDGASVHRLNVEIVTDAEPAFLTREPLDADGLPLLESDFWRLAGPEAQMGLMMSGVLDRGASLAKHTSRLILTDATAEELVDFATQDSPESRAQFSVMTVAEDPENPELIEAVGAEMHALLLRAWEDDDAMTEVVERMRQDMPPYDRLTLVFPDSAQQRAELRATFDAVLERLRDRSAATRRRRTF